MIRTVLCSITIGPHNYVPNTIVWQVLLHNLHSRVLDYTPGMWERPDQFNRVMLAFLGKTQQRDPPIF